MSNPNFSPIVWINFQTGSDYQLLFDKCQIPNFSPTVWMNFQTGSHYQLRFNKSQIANFSTTVWMNFQTGSDYPIAIWQASNPNFSLTVWMNFQTGSDYQLRFDKCQIPNFSPIVVDTGGKITLIFYFIFIFPWYRPPFGECCVWSLSLFRFEIWVVCVWEPVYVCAYERKFGVATNHGKF